MSDRPAPGSNRLFFALYPDAETRTALHQAARSVLIATAGRGRTMAPDSLHLTLVFLGDLTDAQQQAACDAASGVSAQPFTLSVDFASSFKPSRVWWLGTRSPPDSLKALRQQLADRLRDAGLELERRPFTPHITILRDAADVLAPKSAAAVRWSVSDLVLLRSHLDASYEVVQRWPLQLVVEPAQGVQGALF